MEFKNAVKAIIAAKGVTHTSVAEALGQQRQQFANMLMRKNHKLETTMLPVCDALDYEIVLRPKVATRDNMPMFVLTAGSGTKDE